MNNTPHKVSWYIFIKNKAKNHWLITIILVSIILMLGIHIIYKIPYSCEFLIAEWSAGDVLSYAGSIVGAIATIYVLQETIHSTIEMQKEERAFSLRPYFLISAKKYDKDITDNCSVIDISNPIVDNSWTGDIDILIKVQNVGAGNAIVTKVKLSQMDAGNLEYYYTSLPVLVVGSEQLLLIKFCKQSTLRFELICSDIANLAQYRICTNIRIVCSGSKISAYCEVPESEKLTLV